MSAAAGCAWIFGAEMMKPSATWRYGGLWIALVFPLGGLAAPLDQTVTSDSAFDNAVPPIQLAAAIGIVKPEASEPPVTPAEPAPAIPPPTAEAKPAAEEPAEKDTASSGSTSRTILIGAGVAALIGALAGGGGGGGGSSTPQH